MSTSKEKIFVVAGATGKQGGSIIEHLQNSNLGFKIRGLTRDINTTRAKELKSKGVELFAVDFTKPESLDAPLKDADTFFILTDAYDPGQMREDEYKTGVKLVDAAHKNRVSNIIFSTLPNVEKVSTGKWDVSHFTCKARVEEYIRSKKEAFKLKIFVAPAFYYRNYLDFHLVKFNGKELEIKLPLKSTVVLHKLAIEDFGKLIVEIMKKPDQYNEKVIPLYTENMTMRDYMRIMEEELKIPVKYEEVSINDWKKEREQTEVLAKEWAHQWGYFNEFGYYGKEDKYKDLDLGKKIVGEKNLMSWREWLQKNKDDPRWRKTDRAAYQ